jgi:hypothetical protein
MGFPKGFGNVWRNGFMRNGINGMKPCKPARKPIGGQKYALRDIFGYVWETGRQIDPTHVTVEVTEHKVLETVTFSRSFNRELKCVGQVESLASGSDNA